MRLQIEKCIYGGSGLGRAEGKAIFVPLTLPGEVIEAHIIEDKRSFANAELDAVLEASPQRVAPPCEYFGHCGGCHYQHAAYGQQVALKTDILRETLERARLTALPDIIIPVFAEPLGYRNRARLHVQRDPFALCYKKRASHKNLPVSHCPISAPVIEQAIKAVIAIGQKHIQNFSEIEFFTNADESELLISFWTQQAASTLKEICEALRKDIPALIGAAVFQSQDRKVAEWGVQALTYRAAGFAYQVSVGSFFQVNRFLINRLVKLVTSEFSGNLTWDLYAGVGLFTCALGQRFEKVIGVEAAPSSVSDLRKNLSGDTHKAIQSGTFEFLHRQRGPRPDLVIIDPPRTGLGSSVVSILTKVRPQNIVYVSCDPATLSRDLHGLVESGYHIRTLHMVDLFPQTFHLESVTALSLD